MPDSATGCAPAGTSAGAGEASDDASCALAFATDGAITGAGLLSLEATSASPPRAPCFIAASAGLRSGWLFGWREPCLTYLLSATGAPGDFAPSAVVAPDGLAANAQSPITRINAARPLVLTIFGNLPICQSRKG